MITMRKISKNNIYYRYLSYYGRFCAFEFKRIETIESGKIYYEHITFTHNIVGDIEFEMNRIRNQNSVELSYDVFYQTHLENYSWKVIEDIYNIGDPRLSYLIIKRKFLANEYDEQFLSIPF